MAASEPDSNQLKTVKDYIAKYSLEEELSNAVNQAIKLDSDDPYRVISDYLRQFAKDKGEDDDYEDDDDVMAEGEEPVMRPVGRSKPVAAKKFEVPENWTPPVFEKDDAAKEFLKGVMATNKLMKALSPSDRDQLVLAFQPRDYEAGVNIITQGEAGDEFFVLNEGTCDINVAGKGKVMEASKGVAFGELALLHNAPRAATVVATSACTVYFLDEISFKMILMGKAQSDNSTYMEFLAKVPILSHLPKAEMQQMAGALKEIEYLEGKNIICEGEEGDKFYIIREGEVKCTKVGHSEEVSKRLKPGDFFGELALLKDDKRAATVTACTKTQVLALGRKEFDRLLGKLEPPAYES